MLAPPTPDRLRRSEPKQPCDVDARPMRRTPNPDPEDDPVRNKTTVRRASPSRMDCARKMKSGRLTFAAASAISAVLTAGTALAQNTTPYTYIDCESDTFRVSETSFDRWNARLRIWDSQCFEGERTNRNNGSTMTSSCEITDEAIRSTMTFRGSVTGSSTYMISRSTGKMEYSDQDHRGRISRSEYTCRRTENPDTGTRAF